MNPWQAARNLLAVRLDNAGDVVMIGPALRAVKEASPAAQITLLTTTTGAAAAELLPWVDDVITWRPLWQELGDVLHSPTSDLELVHLLRERSFDAALVFSSFSQTPHVPGYVCYLAGIPLRAGESKEFGGRCLTTELRGAPDAMHQVERNLRLAEALGFRVHDRQLAITIPELAEKQARSLLLSLTIAADEPFVLIHPGASAPARCCPPEPLGAAAQHLSDQGWSVLVTGSKREGTLVEQIVGQAPRSHALIGGTTLAELAALIAQAALVICGNSLPLHLADAVQTPVLVLYAGTDEDEQWRPRTSNSVLLRRPTHCAPCYLIHCPIGQACLDLEPTEIVGAATELLAAGRQKRNLRRMVK